MDSSPSFLDKTPFLEALRVFKSDRIRGLLLQLYYEVDSPPPSEFDDRLEALGKTLLSRHSTPLIRELECEVGLSRFETVYLLHVWSEAFHEKNLPAEDLSDLAHWHTEQELFSLLDVMYEIMRAIEAMAEEEGIVGLRFVPDYDTVASLQAHLAQGNRR